MELVDQGRTIERQRDFLRDHCDTIADRAAFVTDAHGDLRPEHIYLFNPPIMIDRLEFSRDLRFLDPLDELAFLAIECERLDAGWIGDFAFACYRDRTGDEPPPALIASYKSLRAGRACR